MFTAFPHIFKIINLLIMPVVILMYMLSYQLHCLLTTKRQRSSRLSVLEE